MSPNDPRAAGSRAALSGWSPVALISFAVILVMLAVAGFLGLERRAPIVTGLPAGAPARMALDTLGGRPTVRTGELRLVTSLDTRPEVAADPRRLAAAERLLLEARREADPRVDGMLGLIALSGHRYDDAERRYFAALDRAPGYGEARLGAALAMALGAQVETDVRRGRSLTLMAIAQLAAVQDGDPCFRPALYDRAVLLARAGRLEEAAACAARYRALEPEGPWGARLAAALADSARGGR